MPTTGRFRRMAPVTAVEGSVEGEDAAVGRHQPVAPRRLVGGQADDRRVQTFPTHRSLEAGVAVGEDPPSDATNQ